MSEHYPSREDTTRRLSAQNADVRTMIKDRLRLIARRLRNEAMADIPDMALVVSAADALKALHKMYEGNAKSWIAIEEVEDKADGK